MPTIQCPECSARLKVGDDAAGQSVACPKCGTKFPVPATAPAAVPAAEILDEDDPPPAKAPKKRPARRDDDEDEDDLPRRKSGPPVAVLATVAGLLLAGGVAVYLFVFRTKEPDAAKSGPAVKGDGLPTRAIPTKSPAAGQFGGVTTVRDAYSVKFPWGQPPEEDIGGPFDTRVVFQARIAYSRRYEEASKDNYEYGVTRLKFRASSTAGERKLAMEQVRKQLFDRSKLTPGAAKPTTLGGQPAEEFVAVGPAGKSTNPPQVVGRLLLTDFAGYFAYVRDHGELRPLDYSTFFDSFELHHPAKTATAPPPPPPVPQPKKVVTIPPDWIWWTHTSRTFRVAFPGTVGVALDVDKILTKYKITAHIQATTVGGGVYLAGSFDYPPGASDDEKERTRNRVSSALGAGIGARPVEVEANGLKWLEYQRRTAAGGPSHVYVRFREVGDAVHLVSARGSDFKTPPALWETFAASYELQK